MQIVIEITDRMYEAIKQDHVPIDIGRFIRNGTPLPKGHGKLIDINEITAFKELECNGHNVESLDEFTVIIEADKESEQMETPNDFNTIVKTITYQMTEDYDNFILEQISDYSENVLRTKINKEELKRIIIRGSKIDDVIDELKTISANARNCRYYEYSDGIDMAVELLEDI